MLEAEERALVRESLEMARKAGAQKARASLSKSSMDLVSTLNGEVDKITSCLDRSLEISIFANGRFGSFSTNKVERESLRGFISDAVDTVRMLAPDPCRDLPSPEREVKGAITGGELGLDDPVYAQRSPEQRRQAALGPCLKEKEGKDWKLISEEGEYSDSRYLSYVIDTNGLEALHSETCFDYGVEITIADTRGRKYSGYWWESSPLLSGFDASDCCRTALRKAIAQTGSGRIRSGRYNMVVDSEVSSKMISPVIQALNGYNIQQHNSFLMDSVGKGIFPAGMTLLDRPHIKGQTGSRLFDSEGVATREHPIIREGVVQEYFLNTYMAAKLGMEPTQEDAIRPVLLPYGCKPGAKVEDLLAACGSGILVTDFNGGNSNSATGDFSYGIEGFRFENGRITKPVSEMLVTGNFLKLWGNFIAAARDARPCKAKLIPSLAFSEVDFSG